MPAPYLAPQQAQDRLAEYGFTDAPPTAPMLMLASDELDLKCGFVGRKADPGQHREFPRTPAVRDDAEGQVPQPIKDWVALRAYQLTLDDEPPTIMEKVSKISVRYARGKVSQPERFMKNLLRPYRVRAARIG